MILINVGISNYMNEFAWNNNNANNYRRIGMRIITTINDYRTYPRIVRKKEQRSRKQLPGFRLQT